MLNKIDIEGVNPTPLISDKVVVYSNDDRKFERPLAVIDGAKDVVIKEELNGAFEMNMSISIKSDLEPLKVGNYIQINGDMFKVLNLTHSKSSKDISVSVECEHIYFELLDDYIEEAGQKSVYPHELAEYINTFTDFNFSADQAVIDNIVDFPKRRVTISRGSPIKTINRALKLWGLELKRFRRDIVFVDGLNKDKIQLFKYQKNISSLEKEEQGGRLTTRLFLIGKEGLSIEGFPVNEIPFKNVTSNGITTILTEDDVAVCMVKSDKGLITSRYIDSKFIDKYPIPKNGEIVDGYIEDKGELLLKGIEELASIDSVESSYTLSAVELKKYAGDIERFGLGYKALIQDEDLLKDSKYNLVEARIIEYEYSPFDLNNNSTIKLGYKKRSSLDFFKDMDDIKDVVVENTGKWDDTADKVDEIKVNNLLLNWDTNKSAMTIDQNENEIASVILEMSKNSDAQGQLLVNMISDSQITLIIRVYDSETQELFSPIISELNRGYNTVGLPIGFYNKKEGNHKLSITAQAINGSAHIQANGVSYNVKAYGGMITNNMLKADDISMTDNSGGEPEIYMIGQGEQGFPVISKALRMYDHIYSDNDIEVVWEMKDLIGAKNLMIEFNGLFRLPFGSDQYELYTQKKPWIFWLKDNGELWGQYGNEADTGVVLATGVKQASVIKGWSMEGYYGLDSDMGLVLAYVKVDGSVSYRQLRGLRSVYGLNNGVWSGEFNLEEAGLDNRAVYVNRLNDYRLVFSVDGVNKLFISDRFYVGQASPIEYVNLDVDVDDLETFITVYPKDDIPYALMPTWDTEDYKTFTLTAEYNWLMRGQDIFADLDNKSGVEIESIAVDELDRHKLHITMKDIVSKGSLKFTPNRRNFIGVHDNGTRVLIDIEVLAFEITYKVDEIVGMDISLTESNIEMLVKREYKPSVEEFIDFEIELSNSNIIVKKLTRLTSNNKETVSLDLELDVAIDVVSGGNIIS